MSVHFSNTLHRTALRSSALLKYQIFAQHNKATIIKSFKGCVYYGSPISGCYGLQRPSPGGFWIHQHWVNIFFFTSSNAFYTGGDQIKELPPAPCAPQGQSTHHCFGVLNHHAFHLSTGLTKHLGECLEVLFECGQLNESAILCPLVAEKVRMTAVRNNETRPPNN